MSNGIKKTEHNGAKNGGGYWGKRREAKLLSNRARRLQSREIVREEVGDRKTGALPREDGRPEEENQ